MTMDNHAGNQQDNNLTALVCEDYKALRNLGVFVTKARALDEQALIRIRSRNATLSHVWTKTPFGPLGCRTVAVSANPDDAVLDAKSLLSAIKSADRARAEEPTNGEDSQRIEFAGGPSVPASWPGFLPVAKGWQVNEYVPAQVFRRLEKQARQVAQENSGPLGLPTSLLDQTVIDIEDQATQVTMRDVFALCSMGFIPAEPDEKEPVRISSLGRWHRLDGRFGSVYTLEGFSVLPMG